VLNQREHDCTCRMQINNVVIRGTFDSTPHIETPVIIAFHSNLLQIRNEQISLKLVRNIRYCLVENDISTLIKLYIEDTFDVDVRQIELKIVNIHSSTTLNLKQNSLIELFIPKLQKIFPFETIGIQQDQGEWNTIPLAQAEKVSALSLRLNVEKNTIKFQLSKTKRQTHLSIITTELNQATKELFKLLNKNFVMEPINLKDLKQKLERVVLEHNFSMGLFDCDFEDQFKDLLKEGLAEKWLSPAGGRICADMEKFLQRLEETMNTKIFWKEGPVSQKTYDNSVAVSQENDVFNIGAVTPYTPPKTQDELAEEVFESLGLLYSPKPQETPSFNFAHPPTTPLSTPPAPITNSIEYPSISSVSLPPMTTSIQSAPTSTHITSPSSTSASQSSSESLPPSRKRKGTSTSDDIGRKKKRMAEGDPNLSMKGAQNCGEISDFLEKITSTSTQLQLQQLKGNEAHIEQTLQAVLAYMEKFVIMIKKAYIDKEELQAGRPPRFNCQFCPYHCPKHLAIKGPKGRRNKKSNDEEE